MVCEALNDIVTVWRTSVPCASLKHASAAAATIHDGVNKHYRYHRRAFYYYLLYITQSVVEYMSLSYICIASHDEFLSFFLRSFLFVQYIWCVCVCVGRLLAWLASQSGTMLTRARSEDQKWLLLIPFSYISSREETKWRDNNARTRAYFIIWGMFRNPYCSFYIFCFNLTTAAAAAVAPTPQLINLCRSRIIDWIRPNRECW